MKRGCHQLSLLVVAVGALGPCACSGEPLTAGFKEPLRIQNAQFREGELPGAPPLTADDINAGVKAQLPAVSGLSLGNAVIPPREPGRAFSGLASSDSVAVGVRFADLGDGYWLLPTGSADAVNDGAVEWHFRAAFSPDLPPGRHQLLFAALDAKGRSGTQQALTLCLLPEIPDNGNACDRTVAPPALVVSLGWDAAVDLDLHLVTPSGKVIDPKHPTSADDDAKGKPDLKAEGLGALDYDSFAGCTPDNRRRENVIFQTTPAAGTYLVYADLFDACGQQGVSFDVSVNSASVTPSSDEARLVENSRSAAQLSAAQADGGARLGTFITSFVVE